MPKTNAKRAKVTTDKRIKIETAKLGAPKVPGDIINDIYHRYLQWGKGVGLLQ